MKIAFFDTKQYDKPSFEKFGKEHGMHFKYFETKLNEDTVELAAVLVNRLRATHPDLLCARYKLTHDDIAEDVTVGEIFDIIGQKRGFLLRGGEINYDRAAAVILDEFRAAKIGRITLDICPTDPEAPNA